MKKKTNQKFSLKKFLLLNIHEITLIFICLGVLVSHTLYVLQTKQFPEMDEQHYMDMAVQFYRIIHHPTQTAFLDMIRFLPFRQPGYSFIILPFLLIFGISHAYAIGLWVNGLLYITSICAVYFLGREF